MEKRIFGYDFVRAMAILLVMAGHSLGFIYAGSYSFFISFLCGFFGVELFFILSGVLIGKLLFNVFESKNLEKSLKNFIIRRWLRTLPLYFIMLIVYFFGNYFFDSVQNKGVSFWKYLFFIQNFYEVQPTFFGISWSLSVEEWFYVLFPLSLFFIKKTFPNIQTKNLFISAVLIFVIYFLLMRILNLNEGKFHFYEGVRKVAFFRLDAIAFGIFSVWLMEFSKEKVFKLKNLLFISGLILLALNQYIIFKDNYSHLKYFNSVYFSVLGIGLALLFPFFRNLYWKKSVVTKSIVFISKISYSLYLVHWLVFRGLELKMFSAFPSELKFILFFILSFCAAAFLYYVIEKPIMKWRNRNFSTS